MSAVIGELVHAAAHTPGPWVVSHIDAGQVIHLDHDAKKSIGICHAGEANARLIAAAPDLVEALQLLTNGFKYSTEVCSIARAALAKAGL